jgi:hypothetical protein
MKSDLFVIIMDNHPKTSIFISRYALSGKGSRASERSGPGAGGSHAGPVLT